MNYRTKLANAVNDYHLGIRVAKLAMDDEAAVDHYAKRLFTREHQPTLPGMDLPDVKPGLKDRLADAISGAGSSVSNAARNFVDDVKKPIMDPQLSLPGIGPSKLRQAAGHRGVQTAGALAGLAGLGGAGIAGVNAYKQHKRNQMLKRIGMGAGGAALLGGGGLLARHLMSDDE